MKKYSILTLDLNKDVTSEQRSLFYKELEERQWKKIDHLTTLWYANWQEDITAENMISTTKNDVAKAAEASNVRHYDASTAICGKPVIWKK